MFLYKNVLFYFQKNNCVDYDLAAGLVESAQRLIESNVG